MVDEVVDAAAVLPDVPFVELTLAVPSDVELEVPAAIPAAVVKDAEAADVADADVIVPVRSDWFGDASPAGLLKISRPTVNAVSKHNVSAAAMIDLNGLLFLARLFLICLMSPYTFSQKCT